MLRSMTGYVLYPARVGQGRWTIEIKSVNHRFLDLSVKLPNFLSCYEQDIRKDVAQVASRGKVYLSLACDALSKGRPAIDRDFLKILLVSLKKAQKDCAIPGEVTLADLMRVPGFFASEEVAGFSSGEWKTLREELLRALARFTKVREKEGRVLKQEITKRISNLRELVEKVQSLKGEIIQGHKARLKGRLEQLAGEVSVDEDRLMKEVSLALERMDVTEELVRLKSHLQLFLDTVNAGQGCGKDLDFVVQEMNREANTIASKVQNSQVSHCVIAMKSEIEKVREQLQNIE